MAHVDAYNRPISYLRISVTDRCNLRCVYCMPPGGVPWRPPDDILRYEEIRTVARAAAELGVSKVRLTGGEPLVRLGVSDLVQMLARIPGIDDLAMTTNGILLARHATELAAAGRAALLIPFPHATHDHQRVNARRMREAGAAELLDPDALTPETLVASLTTLASDPVVVDRMGRRARSLARPHAAERIADLAVELAGGRP